MKNYDLTLSNVPEQYRDLATFIGIEKFIEFCYLYGGSNLYIPTIKTVFNGLRKDEILDMYYKQGRSINEIAREFNLSCNYIRYIVKK
ncbi:MAG: Mor transcription activator family protein [Paraclostridium sp.]